MQLIDTCRQSSCVLLAGVGHFLICRKNVNPLQCSHLTKFSSGKGDSAIWSCCVSLLKFFASKENDILAHSLHDAFKSVKYFGNLPFKVVSMLVQFFSVPFHMILLKNLTEVFCYDKLRCYLTFSPIFKRYSAVEKC